MKYTKKNAKIAALIALPVLGLGILGVASQVGAEGGIQMLRFGAGDPVEAATHQAEMFEHQANLLGISVDEIKQAWAEGKGMKELAEEKGIDQATIQEKMKAEAEVRMKEHVQALVSQGVITQEQADIRIETMKNKIGEMKDRFEAKGKSGMRHGMKMMFEEKN